MILSNATTYAASTFGFAAIADGLAVVEQGGFVNIVVASRLSNAFVARQVSQVVAPWIAEAGQVSVLTKGASTPLAMQNTTAAPRFFVLSNPSDSLRGATLSSTGIVGKIGKIATGNGDLIGASQMEIMEFGATDLAAIVQRNVAGVQLFQVTNNGAIGLLTTIADSPKSYLSGISDLASFTSGPDQFLLTLSATENGLSSFRVGVNGSAKLIDSLGANEGLWMSGPQTLQVVQITGQNFAVIAASGSDSLSVVRMNAMGIFFVADHLIDDQDTRFADVMAMDVFAANGRMFVVAAGTDAGFSVLELLPDGQLSKYITFVRETGAGFANVTGLEAKVIGSEVFLFMTDATGLQVHQFELSLATLGTRIMASGGVTVGTALDERILGSPNADTLQGGAGRDWLHDGAGQDQLSGGAGADVFVFTRDNQTDTVLDFEPGIDKLDLSGWGRLYSLYALDIQTTATGATIDFGAEHLVLTRNNGQSLSLAIFAETDFIF
jgi:serralysin